MKDMFLFFLSSISSPSIRVPTAVEVLCQVAHKAKHIVATIWKKDSDTKDNQYGWEREINNKS